MVPVVKSKAHQLLVLDVRVDGIRALKRGAVDVKHCEVGKVACRHIGKLQVCQRVTILATDAEPCGKPNRPWRNTCVEKANC